MGGNVSDNYTASIFRAEVKTEAVYFPKTQHTLEDHILNIHSCEKTQILHSFATSFSGL
jgi:hypothetical protein